MSRIVSLDYLKIPFGVIKSATNNFADDNRIGSGGFGKVYKGQLQLSKGSSLHVAVKRLDVKISGQGRREFLVEILMLSVYKHDNLVSLVGFCEDGDEKILVYEYVIGESLDRYLATNLTWVQRIRICLGAARGLNYLHSGAGHKVFHRDVKSANILLDHNWEAKISDFGLSKSCPMNQDNTYLVTGVAGTAGYTDPVYIKTGVLSKESDVYSFGVVLFEVLCGRLATGAEGYLSELAKVHYEQGRLNEIIVPIIQNQMKQDSLRTFSTIAYNCLKGERKQRPTMALIVEQLQIALDLQIGSLRIVETQLWGSSTGGGPWWLQFDCDQKLKKIKIDHADWIYSISFATQDFSGSSDSSRRYGGNGGPSDGTISKIYFDYDEDILEIHGTVGISTGKYKDHTVISSLSFVTNKKRTGPFGKKTGTPFSMHWIAGSFGGFYGREGFYLDGLGFYFKDTTNVSI